MKRISITLILMLFIASGYAQKDSTAKSALSLKQAIDYATQNHPKMKNALIDEQIAKNKVREITGMGLPQINSSFDAKDFIELPTSFIPSEFFPGGTKGNFIPVKFGTQYNTTAGFDASQLLFSSDYLVGLQATKAYFELAQKSSSRTKIETISAVEKAYFSTLVSEERVKLLDQNIKRIEKLRDDTKALYENGFVEQVDYSRIVLTYNNLLIEREKVGRFVDLGYTLLKYQMGMDQTTGISLSDKLENVKFDLPDMQAAKFDYASRIEFSLLESQKRMNMLQLKKDRFGYLPSAVLYGSYNVQASRSKFDVFKSSTPWYPVALIGVKVSMPIFDGLQKNFRIQQSKLALTKTENDMTFLKQSIDIDLASSRIALLNNASSLESQKKNIELAEEVYRTTKTKYDQGVGSNIEVLNAETSLKESQTNYFSALYDALIAKVDFEKASGKLNK